jgi:RNA polymerase sigma factor (TIGR02999 family)
MSNVTRILKSVELGDAVASEQLIPLVYDELRQLARAKMAAEAAGNTLSPTALVHEAYLRLTGPEEEQRWDGRGHFYAAAAEAMRRILIERARKKKSVRAGGMAKKLTLLEVDCAIDPMDDRLLALDEALTKLLDDQPPVGQLVKLRYFGGLTIGQAAHAMGTSPRTATGRTPRLGCSARLIGTVHGSRE